MDLENQSSFDFELVVSLYFRVLALVNWDVGDCRAGRFMEMGSSSFSSSVMSEHRMFQVP